MTNRPNILFIMCDQLRWDYLACAGHPSIKTPNIDKLAKRGVRFDRTFVPSPVCGPSRMSIYTGRNVSSHGASWNGVPLPVGELTIGDYLSPDYRVAVAGKTHVRPDIAGLARLGLKPGEAQGRPAASGGFEPFARDDGIHPDELIALRGDVAYNAWLRDKGYAGDNPWHDHANSVEDAHGNIISGWEMKSAPYPARVAKEHSESAYTTSRAIDFIDQTPDRPWLLHLSYIKPHWPYVAPAPYHDMYGPEDVPPAIREEAERRDPQPVFGAFMAMQPSRSFARDEVRKAVIPAYMGLITQIDDEVGRLLAHLEKRGIARNTVIVFTSDHGDYLGDHWMGEKELFHDQSVRVPLIVMDPRTEADATRGTVVGDLIEAIDLVPTFLELADRAPDDQRLEGHSLCGYLRGSQASPLRRAAFSELDYAFYEARRALGLGPNDARVFMIRTERWKYVEYLGFRPQLFDLEQDPRELEDLGEDPNHGQVRAEMKELLFDRLARRRYRVTEADGSVEKRTANEARLGVRIGQW